ncbi:M1 family metallopeptidase [Smaragdicoccus niigatensis]|uniref:M1 family metallopeptidase n=1 Tax=Smaragdicoccus niigatensis TaxID=359359 RepID=UPI000475475F|nr:M1 family metallopeptidase [Smaragdicoccus niigatensis]
MSSEDAPLDKYLPQNGNRGYRVSRYDLNIEYKMSSNRIAGTALIEGYATESRDKFSFDLSPHLTVSKVIVNGKRPERFVHRAGKLRISLGHKRKTGDALTVQVNYAGTPKPINGPWGSVGWDELTEGVIVASQPNGAASWFPCNDHPSSKAKYRITITTDSPYYALANGKLKSTRTKASQRTWVYELNEPTSSYLATVQIGRYARHQMDKGDVPMYGVIPPRLRKIFDHDFARQPKMMKTFTKLFGPFPLDSYTVVVTDDELEIPVEAQGISVFGANHCDGRRGWERLIAHELAHQWFGNSVTSRQWSDIWLHEGFACYAEWLWSEESGGSTADVLAKSARASLARLPHDIVLGDPGPKHMFDDRIYKRGAIMLHALRLELGSKKFFELVREWTKKNRHSTVTTADFKRLAANYSKDSLKGFWDKWLDRKDLPKL